MVYKIFDIQHIKSLGASQVSGCQVSNVLCAVNFARLRCDMYGIPRPSAGSVLRTVHNVQPCSPALSSQLAALAEQHARHMTVHLDNN